MNDDLFTAIRQSELFSIVDDATWQVISECLETVDLENGQSLFRQGDPADGMFVVVSGQLEATISDESGREKAIGKIVPYQPVGEIQALAGGRRTANVVARSKARLVRIPGITIKRLVSDAPDAFRQILNYARNRLRNDQLRTLLPNLLGAIDEKALAHIKKYVKWIHIRRGEVLCRQGDPGDCIYIVVSGRLRAVKEDESGNKKALGKVGRGEIVGEMALLTGGVRSASLVSIRNSELMVIPGNAFEKLAVEHPRAILLVGQTIAQRLLKAEQSHRVASAQMNLAIITADHDLPLGEFVRRLTKELSVHTKTFHLNSHLVDDMLGIPGISMIKEGNPFTVRLSAWLNEQESKHNLMLFEADKSDPAWMRRCLQNADKVLILVPGDRLPLHAQNEVDSLLQAEGVEPSSRVLIFLQPDKSSPPSGTRKWLTALQAQEHYHMRWDGDSDIQRIARFLTGKAVNVVLSGGAACGLAHIGVLRAFEENKIPIDSISGTSMGGVIASQYAMGMRYADLIAANRQLWLLSKPTRDLTLPLISFLRGRKFEQAAKMIYKETRIEDLWLPFCCVSTSLTFAESVIHRKGSLFNAIRASISVPGLVPPAIRDNEILVDGGIMNNLPVDIVRRLFDGSVIAVDVTDAKTLSATQDRFPNPWKALLGRISPFTDQVSFPNILDIIYRSAVVGSRHKTDQAMHDADFYLRIPLEQFKFLEFEAFDRIVDAGYQYADKKIQEWKKRPV